MVGDTSTINRARIAVRALLTVQAALIAYGAYIHSPTWDEPGHLAAGIYHWRLVDFRVYHVNPPLIRLIAALPVMAVGSETDWSSVSHDVYARPEYTLGPEFLRRNGTRVFWLFTLARWSVIPLAVLGGLVCWRWAKELYGEQAGVIAVALWTFCPIVLAFGQQITPDVGAASFGLATNYLFWKWLRDPSWRKIPLLACAFGALQLTKFTWIILFALWPIIWVIDSLNRGQRLTWSQFGQLLICLLGGVYTINFGYAFAGTMTPLGKYQFISRTLAGDVQPRASGNRFHGTFLERIPIPLPHAYVAGIDAQKFDFERGMRSYLRGKWKPRGWWYFYLYGLAIKEPIGVWIILILAAAVSNLKSGYNTSWKDELVLLLPAISILFLVSSQTGFSHHLRYVLPCLPFFYIWASKVARSFKLRDRFVSAIVVVSLSWLVGSSVWVYPHSLSYFNELVGGPKEGHWHLGNSNMDWGQDLLLLKNWYDRRPDARPLHIAYDVRPISPNVAGMPSMEVPKGPIMNRPGYPKTHKWPWTDVSEAKPYSSEDADGPIPGWFALSVNQIHYADGYYEYFLEFNPVDMVGYSTYIYHVSLDDVNRLRRKLGQSELSESSAASGSTK